MGEDGIRNGERESERRTDADATLKMMKKNLHSARDFISPDYAKRARNSESQQQDSSSETQLNAAGADDKEGHKMP